MRLVEFAQTLAESDNPVTNAITRRILLQRTDLLSKYGPEKVMAAIDEVADFVGDVDEIGSSDVSGWIKHVEQMLGNMSEGSVTKKPQPYNEPNWAKNLPKEKLDALAGPRYNNNKDKKVSEAGYYNPLDQERQEQDQMDYNKRAFKRAEMQHELGHEDDPDFERKLRQQAMDRDRGPWYIRIDGKIYRQSGQPKSFDWKKGANNYALAMVKNNPSLQGKVMLSKSSEDK